MKKSSIIRLRKPQRLGEKDWLNLLSSPTAKVEVNFRDSPPRMATYQGWETGTQCIDEDLIYFISEGECAAILDGKRLRPLQGSFCWVSAGTVFRFFARSGEPPPVIYRFRFSVRHKGQRFRGRWPYRFLPVAWPQFELLKQIILEHERPSEFGPWRLRNLLSLLSVAVFESRPVRRQRAPVLDDAQRNSLASLLTAKPNSHPRPSDLARYLGFSLDYFSRIFRRSYGASPRSWLLRQRLLQAAALLRESNLRISEVASKLGYPELYLFSRQFHRMFGTSPSRWRQFGSLRR